MYSVYVYMNRPRLRSPKHEMNKKKTHKFMKNSNKCWREKKNTEKNEGKKYK